MSVPGSYLCPLLLLSTPLLHVKSSDPYHPSWSHVLSKVFPGKPPLSLMGACTTSCYLDFALVFPFPGNCSLSPISITFQTYPSRQGWMVCVHVITHRQNGSFLCWNSRDCADLSCYCTICIKLKLSMITLFYLFLWILSWKEWSFCFLHCVSPICQHFCQKHMRTNQWIFINKHSVF